MQKGPEIKCTSNVSQSEIIMLSEVLQHYDFANVHADKVRSAYKISSDKGDFCLKRVSHGYRKAKKSFSIMKHLKENGFENIADYYYTRDDKPMVKIKEAAFYLTEWIDGRETNYSSLQEILRCSELLAHFHNEAKGFKTPKHVKIRNHTRKWRKTFTKYRDEIASFRDKIDKLKLKAEFDYTYRSCIEHFCREAENAIKILEHSKYSELSGYYEEERCICHDSYYYQNILIDKEDKLFIIDLESCQYDLPMSDLGKLIRRILAKKRFKWDFDLCRRIIESYNKIRPMTREEYEILLAMLVFPHKFWKLGRKRYVKGKQWNENKYRKKLKRLLREKLFKHEFIYCYVKFYGLDLEVDLDIL